MTPKEQKQFDDMSVYRAERTLGPGQRWLTCDDTWALGDEYDGGNGWWKIGGPETAVEPGTKVLSQMLCYTPRGKR